MFLKRKVGITERRRSLNASKAIAMAICPIIVPFSTWRARSMHDVACESARAAVRSKDGQKQLAQTSLKGALCSNNNKPLFNLEFKIAKEMLISPRK